MLSAVGSADAGQPPLAAFDSLAFYSHPSKLSDEQLEGQGVASRTAAAIGQLHHRPDTRTLPGLLQIVVCGEEGSGSAARRGDVTMADEVVNNLVWLNRGWF